MIESLKIKNIQSHKDSQLVFSKGVNVIIGASNQGKSAILRALYWVRYNRPLGIDTLASHWVVNEKGTLVEPMSVVLTNDRGVVERRRTKDDNQYLVDGNTLNVVKTDVPYQVEDILKLSDTNVQKQLDSPFLLSQTSGEVAKYFNSIVNLDVIDKVLTNAESKRRRTKSEIDLTKKSVDELEKKLEEYTWIDEVEPLLNEYFALESRLEVVSKSIESLDGEYNKYDLNIEYMNWLDRVVLPSKSMVEKYERLEDSLDVKEKELSNLESSIESYMDSDVSIYSLAMEHKREVETIDNLIEDIEESNRNIVDLKMGLAELDSIYICGYDVENAKKYINKIDILMSNELDNDISILQSDIDSYRLNMNSIVEDDKEIDRLNKSLPKVCPICGKPLEEDECVYK